MSSLCPLLHWPLAWALQLLTSDLPDLSGGWELNLFTDPDLAAVLALGLGSGLSLLFSRGLEDSRFLPESLRRVLALPPSLPSRLSSFLWPGIVMGYENYPHCS